MYTVEIFFFYCFLLAHNMQMHYGGCLGLVNTSLSK